MKNDNWKSCKQLPHLNFAALSLKMYCQHYYWTSYGRHLVDSAYHSRSVIYLFKPTVLSQQIVE